MAYEKLNLTNGTVLNQDHLAHIEAGIDTAQNRPSIRTVAQISYKRVTSIFVEGIDEKGNQVLLGSGVALPVVRFDEFGTGLTDADKALARSNIGAAAIDEVLLLAEQTLTEEQKAQVRANIGAVTVEDVLTALPTWEGGSY